MAITTTTTLPAAVQMAYSKKLLSVPVPELIHNIPAMRLKMPSGNGTTLRMRRYVPLATATVPLGNTGITPPSQTLSAVNIDADISFYGTYITINEQVTLTNEDPVLNEAAIRLGVSLRETEDELTRDMLASTASHINCVGGVNGDTPTEITRSDIDDIVATLKNNNAKTISSVIEGANKFGTAPVRNAYFALGHTELIGDLDSVQGFMSSAQYPQQEKVLPSEWGNVANIRFLLSSVGSKNLTSSMLGNDIYNIFCLGMEAYAYVEQSQYSTTFIYRDPMYSGPLAMNCDVGWKMAGCPRILNDAWVLNLRCTKA